MFTTFDASPDCACGTKAYGINTRGEIVGFYGNEDTLKIHGFLWSRGVLTAIDAPAANFGTPAFGINSQGDIVGSYTSQACNCGFLLSDRVFTTISPTAPGFSALTGMGIGSNSDIVVGSSLLSGGVFTSIGVPGASVTYSGAINSRGDIAGAYVNAAGIHGFLRDM